MPGEPAPPHMSPDDFRALGRRMVDFIADYWESIETYPVLSKAAPGDVLTSLPPHPPKEGLGAALSQGEAVGHGPAPASTAKPGPSPAAPWDPVFADLSSTILPALTHWQSPSFFAFFPANASFPAILGEMLSAGLGVQGMLWATSPACTELEMRVLDWLAQMLDLPASFRFPRFVASPDRREGGAPAGSGGSVIQGTASEATLTALVAARGRALARASGSAPHLVAYASTQAHSSFIKACMIAGLARSPEDRTHVRLIDVDDELRMRPDALAHAMRDDVAAGRTPFFVMATVGTTSSAAADPVADIARVMREVGTRRSQSKQKDAEGKDREEEGTGGIETSGSHAAQPTGSFPGSPSVPRLSDSSAPSAFSSPWLHVDAAFAGSACICPEFRPLLAGVEHADSLCLNPHKWLLTNFDCDCFFTRDSASLVGAMSVTPEYLRNSASQSGTVVDYRDWHVPLGRRFRALKLWFVIRHYGVRGLQAHIREHVRLASLFESLLARDDRFELAAPRLLSLACFRLRPRPGEAAPDTDARNMSLLGRINASGRAYLTHTVLPARGRHPRLVLRMAVGATLTREEHVAAAWDLIRREADRG